MITSNTLKAKLDQFYIDEIIRLEYSTEYSDWKYDLYTMIDALNKRKELGLNTGLVGDNIDYMEIYYNIDKD